jgi:hypothetical protein
MTPGGTTTPAGILFGPNDSGKQYLSTFAHRGGMAGKAEWVVPPPTEYDIFCSADAGNWRDVDGHYWGVHLAGDAIVGSRGERLCKFPYNENERNPWHGYPVSPLLRGDDDAPPDDVVNKWIEDGIISVTKGRRIQRRKW